jgi:hypothetical protein
MKLYLAVRLMTDFSPPLRRYFEAGHYSLNGSSLRRACLPLQTTWSTPSSSRVRESLASSAHLTAIVKALGATPILSPATPTIEPRANIPVVDQRDPNLRHSCLRRDGHRCVITQKFDSSTAIKRLKRDRDNARDDDGNHLAPGYELLQVSHIVPFSLASQQAKENRDIEVCESVP